MFYDPVTIHLKSSAGLADTAGIVFSWWRHQMETFSALLALCEGEGEFPAQRAVQRSFDVFFDLHLNKRLSKQSKHRWFETPSHSLWRHCNVKFVICTWGVAYQWTYHSVALNCRYTRFHNGLTIAGLLMPHILNQKCQLDEIFVGAAPD